MVGSLLPLAVLVAPIATRPLSIGRSSSDRQRWFSAQGQAGHQRPPPGPPGGFFFSSLSRRGESGHNGNSTASAYRTITRWLLLAVRWLVEVGAVWPTEAWGSWWSWDPKKPGPILLASSSGLSAHAA